MSILKRKSRLLGLLPKIHNFCTSGSLLQAESMVYDQRQLPNKNEDESEKNMWGVPNYHLKTTLSTFGGSIFSGTKLKANTKMETDVETSKSSSARLYIPCFHLFSLSLPLYPLCWPNITRGGWKNKSKTVVTLCCEVSDQTQPITMNLQWTAVRKLCGMTL